MLESVHALVGAGWSVTVCSPTDGPLRPRLEEAGAHTRVLDYPVLRRADSTAGGLARLGTRAVAALPGMRRAIRDAGAEVVYVNTVTLPWWLAAARSASVPSLCHVHE